MQRPLLPLAVFLCLLSAGPAAADELELAPVPPGRAGTPLTGRDFAHLRLRAGVTLLHGPRSLRDRYPYLVAPLPEGEPVALSAESAAQIFEPIETPEAAAELVRLLHAGLLVRSGKVHARALEAAHAHGFQPAILAPPTSFGLQARAGDGGLDVDLLLYETSTQLLGLRTHRYRFQEGACVKHTVQTWLEGPAQHWQTAGEPDPKAEAARHQALDAFRQALEAACRAPDLAPHPFTAAQIREATRVGRTYVFRMGPRPPRLSRMRFVEVDEEGCTIEQGLLNEAGELLGQARSQRSTWEELVKHASYPAARTEIARTEVKVPAGSFPCLLYTVREEERTTRAYFALELPGAPVKMSVSAGGQDVFTMELEKHTPGE